MSKKILFCSLFILIFLIPSKQAPNAKTWERNDTTVSADSILAAIDRGDSVIIYGCEILGLLKKGSIWETPDTIKSYIWICSSTFLNAVSFENCCFIKKVSLYDDTLSNYVRFFKVSFDDDVDFSGIVFKSLASFSQSKFSGYANFIKAIFHESADFSDATFKKLGSSASFWSDTFHTHVSFNHTHFKGSVDFTHTTFGEGATFFGVGATFRDATFDGDADFMDANFGGPAFFVRTAFSKLAKANFSWATFDTYTSFMYASFEGTTDFSHTGFGGSADFSRTTFGGQVILNPKEFKNIYISWKQLKGYLVYDPSANLRLMKHFEENRQLVSADGVYLFLKDHERMNKSRLRRYFEYWLIQQTCGYGVKPQRVLATSGLVIIFFAIFYYLIKIREPKWALGAGLKRIGIKAWNALYFSINTFVIGAPIEWTPEDTRSSKRHYLFRILTTVERTFGWILLVLFVVTLTRKFIR